MRDCNALQRILIIVILLCISALSFAQSRQSAMLKLNEGNYSNAIAQLTALEQMYPGSYKTELSLAKTIRNLSYSAKQKFNAKHYTEAEELYNKILQLNPNDRSAKKSISDCKTAREEFWAVEYEKCNDVYDFENFIEKWPNAPQAAKAREILYEHNLLIQDNRDWTIATGSGTISSYTKYISINNPKAKHVGEAYLYRARLHYKANLFNIAKADYESASKRNVTFSSTDTKNYKYICDVLKFETFSKYTPRNTLLEYKSTHPNSHTAEINGLLVASYCVDGQYDLAIKWLNIFGTNLQYPSVNGYIYWTTKQWKQYIRSCKRNFGHIKGSAHTYNGNYSSKNQRRGLGWMFGIGASIDCYGAGYRLFSPEVFLSMGDFYNRFNMEMNLSYMVNVDSPMFNLGCAPRWNIAWHNGSTIFLQPEVSYDLNHNVLNYGGRIGVGAQSKIGVFSLSSMYNGYLDRTTWGISYTFYFGR